MEDKQENENVIGMPVQNVLLIIIAIGTDIVQVTPVFLHQTMTMMIGTGITTMVLLFKLAELINYHFLKILLN